MKYAWLLAAVSAAGTLVIATACSSSSDENTAGPGGTSPTAAKDGAAGFSAAQCNRDCAGKAGECGLDSAQGKSVCSRVCTNEITEELFACFQALSCDALSQPLSVSTLCDGSGNDVTLDGGMGDDGDAGTFACRSAQCGAFAEYCALGLKDVQWLESGQCKPRPDPCSGRSVADVCTCMKEQLCPKEGKIRASCTSTDAGLLKFGCEKTL